MQEVEQRRSSCRVAMNAGNAAGAKGHRFEIVNRGNMPRHRADYAHDNQTYSLHAMSVSSPMVNDSNWEPEGVTLQVRFCEGGASYQGTEIRAATSHCLIINRV